MRKIYYLKTCDTCKRILKSLPSTEGFAFQDIKEQPLAGAQLEHYTFLNRPVIVVDDQVFVGNSPKVVAQAIAALS